MLKVLTCFAAAAVMLTPMAAPAQSAASFLDEETTNGRLPRLPVDKTVPADASGELAGVRGKAWWQLLIYCAAVYKVRDDALRQAGDSVGALSTEVEGKGFIGMGLQRLEEDRGLNPDAAGAILGPEFVHYFGLLNGGPGALPFEAAQRRCAAVRTQYEAARSGW